MAENDIKINLNLDDKASKRLVAALEKTQKHTKKTKMSFVELAAKVYVLQRAFMVMSRALSVFIKNAAKVEQLNTRLKVLLGTVKKGNALFDDMRELASALPFEFENIMESATNLAAVVKDGGREVNQLMPIIADLSAATGISIQDTTSQMIRMYSAGAASADMFRERGVLAMLGFQAGVSVSAEDTMKQVVAAWEDPNSNFAGATDELRKTWDGTISVMKDAWFNFTAEIGKNITGSEGVKGKINEATTTMNLLTAAMKDAHLTGLSFGELLLASIVPFSDKLLISAMNTDRLNTQLEELTITRGRAALFAAQMAVAEGAMMEIQNLRMNVAKEKAGELAKEYKKLADSLSKNFSTALSSVITGASSAREAFSQLGKAIVKTLSDFVAQMIINATIGKVLQTAATAASLTQAAIIASAWTAPAALVSLATFGGNAAPAATGIASVIALTKTLSAINKATPFAEGGIVTRPTNALIGEAGPEAVIPLDRAGGIGDTSIVVNIMGGIDPAGDSVESVAEELGFLVEADLREARGF